MRYDYKCLEEGVIFEIEQKLTEPELQYCPTCWGPVKKQVSKINFELKGQGWFKSGGY